VDHLAVCPPSIVGPTRRSSGRAGSWLLPGWRLRGAPLNLSLGPMAMTLRRLLFPAVESGAIGRDAFPFVVQRCPMASASAIAMGATSPQPRSKSSALPLAFSNGRASVNAALPQLVAHFSSPRFRRNVSLRRGRPGRASVEPADRMYVTRVMREVIAFAVHGVTCAGFGRVVEVGAALWPNQAFERTRRFSASTWPASARRAAQLDR